MYAKQGYAGVLLELDNTRNIYRIVSHQLSAGHVFSPIVSQMSNFQTLGYLGYMGDHTTQPCLFVG